METKKKQESSPIQEMPQTSVQEYDDGNIPEIDTRNLIPDEVPRRDGPGGN